MEHFSQPSSACFPGRHEAGTNNNCQHEHLTPPLVLLEASRDFICSEPLYLRGCYFFYHTTLQATSEAQRVNSGNKKACNQTTSEICLNQNSLRCYLISRAIFCWCWCKNPSLDSLKLRSSHWLTKDK